MYLSGPVSERYTRVKLLVVGEGVGLGVGVTLMISVTVYCDLVFTLVAAG